MLNTGGDPELERKEIELLFQRQVDGVLHTSMYHRVVEYHRIVEVPEQLRSVPTVLLDARADDLSVPSVGPDEVQGGATAVRELLRHGYRRIGFINNVDDIPAIHGRLEGYRQALAEAGVTFGPRLVAAETASAASAYRAALTLLRAAERRTALFCFADRMAMGVHHAAAEPGLSIPADLSFIGFDNQELIFDGMFPGLTTVALPHYEMGARDVAQVLALTGTPDREPGPAAQEMLPCPLVARASVASPPRLVQSPVLWACRVIVSSGDGVCGRVASASAVVVRISPLPTPSAWAFCCAVPQGPGRSPPLSAWCGRRSSTGRHETWPREL